MSRGRDTTRGRVESGARPLSGRRGGWGAPGAGSTRWSTGGEWRDSPGATAPKAALQEGIRDQLPRILRPSETVSSLQLHSHTNGSSPPSWDPPPAQRSGAPQCPGSRGGWGRAHTNQASTGYSDSILPLQTRTRRTEKLEKLSQVTCKCRGRDWSLRVASQPVILTTMTKRGFFRFRKSGTG